MDEFICVKRTKIYFFIDGDNYKYILSGYNNFFIYCEKLEDKNITYILSTDNMNKIIDKSKSLFKEYDYLLLTKRHYYAEKINKYYSIFRYIITNKYNIEFTRLTKCTNIWLDDKWIKKNEINNYRYL